MKRAIMFAAALMAGITMAGSPQSVQAASVNHTAVKIVKADGGTLKECLENLQQEQWGNCTVIAIPCIPGTGEEIPELPGDNGAENPGTPDAPETPDTGNPGQDDTTQSVHAYVLRVAELVNEERAKAGLKPLTLETNITAAAQVRAVETEQSFSHTRPDGRHFSTALAEAGVSYRGAGENIAWGQKTPEQVMNGWMNSAGHRANILNEKFTSIGVGYYQNANGVNYWSQLFTY